MLSKEAKSLINGYVSERKTLETLTPSEYRHLIAENLRHHPDKASIIADVDDSVLLPNAIAHVIQTNASESSVRKLINAIMELFVHGTPGERAAFELDFNEVFEDEWNDQHPSANEHWLHDCRERARAASWGMES